MIQDLNVLTAQIKSLIMPLMDAVHRNEFAQTNDTDFAYQLDDDARFRSMCSEIGMVWCC